MSQSEQAFNEALNRYLAGASSPEETAIIEAWFEKEGNIHKEGMQLSAAEQLRLLHNIHKQQAPVAPRTGNILFRKGWQAAAIGAGILLVAGALLWKTQKTPLNYTAVVTGIGEMKTLVLPDSSTVTINANSTLRYPSDFAEHREIALTGEAVFQVTEDAKHPFMVTTEEGVHTTVLGTEFNIRNYHQAKELHIAVLSGKVQISKADTTAGILVAQQVMHYHKETRHFIRETVAHPEWYSKWTSGIWEYEHFNFTDLALLLQNQYGVTVQTGKANAASLRTNVSVNFSRQQKATDILDFFCLLTNSRYRKINNTVMEIY